MLKTQLMQVVKSLFGQCNSTQKYSIHYKEKLFLKNFVVDICGSKQEWSAASYVETTVEELKKQVGNDRVILGLSGGVDSTVCAMLLKKDYR